MPRLRSSIVGFTFSFSLFLGVAVAQPDQVDIPAVLKMAQLPSPLDVRDWQAISRKYYELVLDPGATGDSFPAVKIDPAGGEFQIKTYLGGTYGDEAMTCLSAVIGSKMVGLDPENLNGINYLRLSGSWYDSKHGVYRDRPRDTSAVLHADLYGYWPAIQGMMLSALYPADSQLARRAQAAVEAFRNIAHGMGCPGNPNFDVLGWDFEKMQPGGRQEPMNRLGNAPSVAWVLLVGSEINGGDRDLIDCARSTMQWYVQHPGRYEISHVMGPLVAARLNALGDGESIDLGKVFNAWFGDGDDQHHPWGVTQGTNFDGLTCDGLDGARRPNNGFYAFTMGTLQDPAWLVPVARYQPQYARAIGRYALNAANSVRLLEGYGLDADHQDHAAWKAQWDPDNLLFYEGLASSDPTPEHQEHPYARGDPVLLGWGGHPKVNPKDYFAQRKSWFGNTPRNIALYMGNHVGFLGGILRLTDVPGILSWDCVKTDWFHPPAYPTQLIYNPYPTIETPTLDLGPDSVDLYDACQARLIARGVRGKYSLTLPADTAMVLVSISAGEIITNDRGHSLAGGLVIDWNAPSRSSK